jgi:2-phosphosulfolactate phosphatase
VQLDVHIGGRALSPADTTGRLVLVIDVLRASTSIAVALCNGARAVIPFESMEEVVTRGKQFDRKDVVLAGERKMLPISGFDVGNSPLGFTRELVEGKAVLLTTTNGTAALVSVHGARDVVVGSYVNFSAVAALLRSAAPGAPDIAIVCAGREREFSLEDAASAGRNVRAVTRRLQNARMNDAARACALIDRRYGDAIDKVLADSEHGRALIEAGFADDLPVCAALDSYPVIPVYQDRQVTRLGPDRAR